MGPGQYAINYTKTEPRATFFNFSKSKNVNYIEDYVRMHKSIPAPGKYVGVDKAMLRLSRPISSISRKRI
jgi:hypothetical protein